MWNARGQYVFYLGIFRCSQTDRLKQCHESASHTEKNVHKHRWDALSVTPAYFIRWCKGPHASSRRVWLGVGVSIKMRRRTWLWHTHTHIHWILLSVSFFLLLFKFRNITQRCLKETFRKHECSPKWNFHKHSGGNKDFWKVCRS